MLSTTLYPQKYQWLFRWFWKDVVALSHWQTQLMTAISKKQIAFQNSTHLKNLKIEASIDPDNSVSWAYTCFIMKLFVLAILGVGMSSKKIFGAFAYILTTFAF